MVVCVGGGADVEVIGVVGLVFPRLGTKPVEVLAPAVAATRLITSRVACIEAAFTLERAVGRASCDTCALTETELVGAGSVLGKGDGLCTTSLGPVGAEPDGRAFAASWTCCIASISSAVSSLCLIAASLFDGTFLSGMSAPVTLPLTGAKAIICKFSRRGSSAPASDKVESEAGRWITRGRCCGLGGAAGTSTKNRFLGWFSTVCSNREGGRNEATEAGRLEELFPAARLAGLGNCVCVWGSTTGTLRTGAAASGIWCCKTELGLVGIEMTRGR